jgi:hypothetical protein
MAAVGTWGIYIGTEGNSYDVIRCPVEPEEIERRMLDGDAFLMASMMCRTETLMAVGGYRPLPTAEDVELMCRLTEGLPRVGCIPQCLYAVRSNPTSVRHQDLHRHRAGSFLVRRAIRARRTRGQDILDGLGREQIAGMITEIAQGQGALGRQFIVREFWGKALGQRANRSWWLGLPWILRAFRAAPVETLKQVLNDIGEAVRPRRRLRQFLARAPFGGRRRAVR